MRILIGVILGVLIVFNWSSIRSMFDSSLQREAQVHNTAEPAPPGKAEQPVPVQPQDLNGAVEQRLKELAVSQQK